MIYQETETRQGSIEAVIHCIITESLDYRGEDG